MAGDTTLTYNTVPLSFIRTSEVEAEGVRDPLADKDLLYVRRTIRVEAVLAGLGAAGTVPPARPGESPAQTMARVEHLLSVPRRPFVYAVNGVVLYKSDGLDPAGGPFPKPPKITKLTANSFHIAYEIVVCSNDCAESGLPKPIWSSLRWTQEHQLNEANYAVIVTAGRLIANADMLKNLVSIDQLRGVTVPPVPPNFVRQSRYLIAADGLALDFTHTDTEQHIGPPADVTRMKGTARHYFVKGGVWHAEVSLTMEGRKDVPKQRLMATCLAVAFNRLKKAWTPDPKRPDLKLTLREGAMSEALEKNEVHVKLLALTSPPNTTSNKDQSGEGFWYRAGEAGGALVLPWTIFLGNTSTPPDAVDYLAAHETGDTINTDRDKAKRDAEKGKAPPVGVLPGDLSQWGSPLLGCTMPTDKPRTGIGPDLYGNLPQFRLIASVFADPCLDYTTAIAEEAKKQFKQEKHQVTAYRPPTQPPGPPQPPYPTVATVMILNGLPSVPAVRINSAYDTVPGVFEEYHVECEYRRRGNTAVLPATTSGGAGKQVSWANPEIFLRCTWTVTKWGGPPTVPAPDPKDTNTVLIDSSFVPMNVDVGPDGMTPIYSVAGCFDYQFLDVAEVNLAVPRLPWLNATVGQLPAFPTDPGMIFDGPMTNTLRSQQR